MSVKWQGKLAVVTGASGGIGYETAKELARSGARLVLVARNVNRLAEIQRELAPQSDFIKIIGADLSVPGATETLIEQLEALPFPVDILVNNAGVGISGEYLDGNWQALERMMQLNMTSLARLSHWAGNRMKARGTGFILNVSAVLACQPVPYFGLYSATKAFVTSFSQALYQELKPYGVVVSAIHPPATATAFAEEAQITKTRAIQWFGYMPAATVARAGLRGLAVGQPHVVPGLLGKAIYYSAPFTPRAIGLAVMQLLFKVGGTRPAAPAASVQH